jgi:phosphoenolpyruvate-protein phosphotransferase (PTS system enzyme I)
MAKSPAQPERIFPGTPVSGGVARGVVRFIEGSFEEPPTRRIAMKRVDAELQRFHDAIAATRSELEGLMARLTLELDKQAREVIEMHIMVLEDGFVQTQVETFVRENLECAESAYYRVVKNYIDSFQRIPDAYMRERALDIRDVAQRVLRKLRGEDSRYDDNGPPAIFIAHDLTPGEAAQMDRGRVLGFAVELGSKTSHTAIVARSLGIPAVVRLHGVTEALHHGDDVLLDGDEGLLILNPTRETLSRYKAREAAAEKKSALLLAGSAAPAITKDGRRITVGANAEFVEEMTHIAECGAEGVGLFRTEFLYIENPSASEERLTEVYSEVVKAVSPELVIFRTLDIGGDKLDPDFHGEHEQNPFLGWRGIRVSLVRSEIFKQQIRAILRSSVHGQVGIMYPMISSVNEVLQANALLAQCRAELIKEGVKLPKKIQVGAMIEIPSAAAIADMLAKHVDFFSIGTNDLVQYTLAVDRVNERVSYLYQPTHPAVIRLIKSVVEAAHKANVWVGMCGEMAGDVTLTPLLIGLGLDELSAASSQVAKIKHAIRHLDAAKCDELVQKILLEPDADVIQSMTLKFALEHYGELLTE